MEKKRQWNNPQAGAPKIGGGGGEKPPPGKYVFEFLMSKSQNSQNKMAKTQGNPQVILEFNIIRVLEGGTPKVDWKGNTRTAYPGVRRSQVIDMTKPSAESALGELNQLCIYLHCIDAKDPAALREAGVSAKDDTREEIARANEEQDKLVNNVVDSTDNPLLGIRVECEVKDVDLDTREGKRTYLRYTYSLCTNQEDIDHNMTVLAGPNKAA